MGDVSHRASSSVSLSTPSTVAYHRTFGTIDESFHVDAFRHPRSIGTYVLTVLSRGRNCLFTIEVDDPGTFQQSQPILPSVLCNLDDIVRSDDGITHHDATIFSTSSTRAIAICVDPLVPNSIHRSHWHGIYVVQTDGRS